MIIIKNIKIDDGNFFEYSNKIIIDMAAMHFNVCLLSK